MFIDVPKFLMSLHQHHFCFLLAFTVGCCHPCCFFLLPFDACCIQHTIWHQNFHVEFYLVVYKWACQNQCIAVASQFPSLLQSLGNTKEVEGAVWDKCHILHYNVNNLHPFLVANYTWYVTYCNRLFDLLVPHDDTHTFFGHLLIHHTNVMGCHIHCCCCLPNPNG